MPIQPKYAIAAAAAGLALALHASGALAAPIASDATLVDELTVTAASEVRLTVALGGDVGPKVIVTSAPAGLNCGGSQFRYTLGENRQCWIWVKRNQPVMLTAQGLGGFGVDWTVEWVGCEPAAGGAVCQLTPATETQVAAVFVRPTP